MDKQKNRKVAEEKWMKEYVLVLKLFFPIMYIRFPNIFGLRTKVKNNSGSCCLQKLQMGNHHNLCSTKTIVIMKKTPFPSKIALQCFFRVLETMRHFS